MDFAADACKKPDPGVYKHVLIRPHVLSLRDQSQSQRLAYPGVNKHHAVRPGTSLDPASQASSPRASPKILPPGARSRHQQVAQPKSLSDSLAGSVFVFTKVVDSKLPSGTSPPKGCSRSTRGPFSRPPRKVEHAK